MGNIMIGPITLNADDIRKINLLMPKLASPVIKVLKQFAQDDKEALEILKLHTYLLLEFDKPYPFYGEKNASTPNNSEEIHKAPKPGTVLVKKMKISKTEDWIFDVAPEQQNDGRSVTFLNLAKISKTETGIKIDEIQLASRNEGCVGIGRWDDNGIRLATNEEASLFEKFIALNRKSRNVTKVTTEKKVATPDKAVVEKPEKETAKEWEATGNVQLCFTDVAEYNVEKLTALFEKLWPGYGKRKAAQLFEMSNLIKSLNERPWRTIPDPGKKMSKPDLCLKLAEIGINARIS